jgi:hypothetical protein
MIVAITVAVRKDPRSYYLIHGSKEAMGSYGDGDIGAKNAGLLAFTQNAFNHVKVFHQKVMRKLAKKLGAVAQFGLENNGQAAVGTQRFKMKKCHAAQLFPRIFHLLQRIARPLNKAVESRVNGRHEQFVFVFEIEIDGAVRNTGAVGNFSYPGMEKAMLGDDFNRGIQDALRFI